MNERSIFLEALEHQDLARRGEFLDRACGGDAALREAVDELLAAWERTGDFMVAPGGGLVAETEARVSTEGPGSRVGPYKLLQRIGEGGMGSVYMAQQEEPVRRTVALKIIRDGLDTRDVLARFEAERQALALMDHPNIAKVLDAGTTDSGRPYFVMELVKGVPITRFCDERNLDLRERLELFVPVCQAIQHAHQKGVIHRDIKPSNVLVALYDDRPVPKVIDFGVAKATSQKLTDKTLFTLFGTVVGTLEYMSPEQARLNQLDIDTRSDVYSLGVLLYELLTGGTPIGKARLKTAALDEVLRLIREEEIPKPSTRLSFARTQPAVGPGEAARPGRLGRLVKGELDWIVMKALEKDRSRRYETANGLARDVERFLKDEPVEACPPTLGYRLRKFHRKNRAAVGVAAAFVLLLTVATATSAMLALRAVRAERIAADQLRAALRSEMEARERRAEAEAAQARAQQEARRAQAVRDFLREDLLRQASPLQQAETRRQSGGDHAVTNNPTIRELLDRAAARLAPDRIEARFPGMPVVQAEVLATVGDTYSLLGESAKGEALLERSVELHRSRLGPEHPATLEARQGLALLRLWIKDDASAVAEQEEIVAARIRVQGPDHEDTFVSRERLGAMYLQTRLKDPVEYLRRLRDDAARRFGPNGFHTLYASHDLSESLISAGKPAEALEILERMLAAPEVVGIPRDHPYHVRGMGTLARAYVESGRPEKAVEILRPIYEHAVAAPNAAPGTIVEAALSLHAAMVRAGRRSESVPLLEKALALTKSIRGGTGPGLWHLRHSLAWDRANEGRIDEAIALFRENLPDAGTPAALARTNEAISNMLIRSKRFEEALDAARKALAALVEAGGSDARSWDAGKYRICVGQRLAQLGRIDEAVPHFAAGYDEVVEKLAEMPDFDQRLIDSARRSMVEIRKTPGKPDPLRTWTETRLPTHEPKLRGLADDAKLPPRVRRAAAKLLALGLVDRGRLEEAAALHAETLRRIEAAGWSHNLSAPAELGELRDAVREAGRPDLANAMRDALLASLDKSPDAPRDLLARETFAAGFRAEKHPGGLDEAIALYREAVELMTKSDPEAWNTTKFRLFLGEALAKAGETADAEPILRLAFEESVRKLPKAPAWERHFPNTAATALAALCENAGRKDEAAKWRTEAGKHPKRTQP